MKKAFVLASLLFLSLSSLLAQKGELIQLNGSEFHYFFVKTQYKFPEYTRAKIAFKNGDVASARINYNNFQHVVRYIDNTGTALEVTNPEDIDYIAVGADTIFSDNGYFEWVATSGTARLAVRRIYKEAYRALVGPFGTNSPAKHVEGAAGVRVNGISSTELSSNEVITLSKETIYYISPLKNGKINFVEATKKNLEKLFPKKDIADFIRDNRINLNKEKDLIDLMVYISKPKNQ